MENLTFTSIGMSAPLKEFPKELRMGFFQSLDREFVRIFLVCLGVFVPVFLIGALMEKPKEPSASEMEDIQARYAKLVLNKEIPKEEEKEEEKVEAARETAAKKKEEKKIDRKKESVAQKRARKQATSEQRAKKREALKKEIENVGLFAELTAVGGSGGSARAVQDLIGDVDATAGLADMDISSGSFVQKKSQTLALRERRGQRSAGGTIQQSALLEAKSGTFKSSGKVELNRVDNIQGEAAADASRSMQALTRELRKHQPRLKRVYENYLKRNPDLAGKIVIKFTIEADGSVSDVKVISSDLNNRELERDLIRRIKRIKFKSASGKITIEWPLIFSQG
jgi:TonB family protein